MADAGGVSIQLPADPLQKTTFFSIPPPASQVEADLYSKLKKLQRDLEFLSLQEVTLPFDPEPTLFLFLTYIYRNTLKMNNVV